MRSHPLFFYIITLTLFIIFPFFSFTNAQTSTTTPDTSVLIKQLQLIITSLQSQINDLKAQIESSKKEIETVKVEVKELKLTRSLFRGATGDDVKQLQQYLVSQFPDLYPAKQVTGYFGPATEAAIKKLQEKNGIESIGIVGPKTLSKLNELITQGAGESGKIPPGLLTAPGLERELSTGTPPVIPPGLQNFPITASGTIPAILATTTGSTSPSIIPATPAVPATPAQPISQTGVPTVPATPATPAQPAQISTSTTDTLPPSTPSNFTASFNNYSIWLYWSKSTDNIGVVGYKIYKNNALIFSAATSSSLATLAYSDYNGIAPGTTYNYAVAAYDATGNVSAQSVFSVTTLALAGTNSSPSPSPSSSPSPSPSSSPTPSLVGTIKWSFYTSGNVAASPAVGNDGTIYIPTEYSKLFAVNPSGTQKWVALITGITYSSPAIGPDGTVYIGSWENKLYAINPDGTQKWIFNTNGQMRDMAIGMDGTIYAPSVASGSSNLYAINPNGTQKWIFNSGTYGLYNPIVGPDGTVYVASYNNKLIALNPNGTQKWVFGIGALGVGVAIGSDNTIYISSGYGDNKLYAVNPNGTQKWVFAAGYPNQGGLYSTPTIGADGTIYSAIAYNSLYAINPNGTQKWAFTINTNGSLRTLSPPTIGIDGVLYVASTDGKIYALNADGTQKWLFSLGIIFSTSPAIIQDGTVYIGSNGYLYALSSGSFGLANSSWPKFHKDNQNTASNQSSGVVSPSPSPSSSPSPSLTPAPDTTSPTISGIQSIASSTEATITWTTDESSDSQIEYGANTAYGSATTLNTSLVTSHAVSLTGLTAGATYHYRVKSKDAAGNIATSADQTFTTLPPPVIITAPTDVRPSWLFGYLTPDGSTQQHNIWIRFKHTGDSPAKFRMYQKKPGEISFSKAAEFSANFSSATPCYNYIANDSATNWHLDKECDGAWRAVMPFLPLSSYLVGEYKFYVVAVDNAGNEAASAESSLFNLATFSIISPTTDQSPTPLQPTFQWNIANGWPQSSVFYTVFVYDEINATGGAIYAGAFSVPTNQSIGQATYNGPALDPAKRYIVSIVGRHQAAPEYISMSSLTQRFWVTTATSTAAATNIKTLAAMLQSLSQLLQQLRQILP